MCVVETLKSKYMYDLWLLNNDNHLKIYIFMLERKLEHLN